MPRFNHRLYNDKQFRNRPKKVYHAYAQAVWKILHPKSIIDLGCTKLVDK